MKEGNDFLSHVGKFFELCELFVHALVERGSTYHTLLLLLKKPYLVGSFADVCLGKSEIVNIDPFEVVNTTGQTDEIKRRAIEELLDDDSLLTLLSTRSSDLVALEILKRVQNSANLVEWHKQLSDYDRSVWQMRRGDLWGTIFQKLDDSYLFEIAMLPGTDSFRATRSIWSQDILKRLYYECGIGFNVCQVVSQIDDLEFIQKNLDAELSRNTIHRRTRLINDLRNRETQLKIHEKRN